MQKIRTKFHASIMCCAALFCCSKVGAVELLGSPDPKIRRNFNQLLVTNACRGCDLRGAVLNRLNLAEADLEGADMTDARLNATSLTGANLRGAVLRGASLGGADLTGANLVGTNLEGADFTLSGKPSNSAGQQVTAAAANEVNNVLSGIFAGELGADALNTQETTLPRRRDVDEIPVIETETVSENIAEEIKKDQPIVEKINQIDVWTVSPSEKTAATKTEVQPAQPVGNGTSCTTPSGTPSADALPPKN
ncbi:MAG: Pentapeptide repeat-containing protein [Candidatus Electronema aureum]|uniref:Pentapeptide repeat-containing protein n=1 Tax=Candidatus Electronema aureum TaxID=2005002 RepID=A0A521G3P5_9BACT|nr:MAG: Pentapeptide repeat-containing protein [Candidatus Electronema aureum]